MAYGTRRGPLFWVGWALVLPGLSALMIAVLLGFWSQQLVPLIIGQFLGEEVFVFDLLVDVLEQVNHRYVLEVIWTCLAVATAGAALILVWGWRNWRVGQR